MRPIVSYADITPVPQDLKNTTAKLVRNESVLPTSTTAIRSCGKFEESRELTHEEIWDDSALIEAWNAATEEYEVMNGPDKSWKEGPIHKSPLWYNVPPMKSSRTVSVPPASVDDTGNHDNAEVNSQPIDFDTYVPSYNPNLESSLEPLQAVTKAPRLRGVGQDEAFSHAMNAMYWAGYWTAIYHSRHQEEMENAYQGDLGDEGSENEQGEVELVLS